MVRWTGVEGLRRQGQSAVSERDSQEQARTLMYCTRRRPDAALGEQFFCAPHSKRFALPCRLTCVDRTTRITWVLDSLVFDRNDHRVTRPQGLLWKKILTWVK